jgi:hypothetical protein
MRRYYVTFGFVYAAIVVVILSACEPSIRPPLDENTYKQIRMELELLHALHTYTADKTMTAAILDSLRSHYNFTDEEFLKSYQFYERQLQDEILRFESMANLLDTEHIRLHEFMIEQRRIREEIANHDKTGALD